MSIEQAIRAIVVEEIQKYMNQGMATSAQPAIAPVAPPAPTAQPPMTNPAQVTTTAPVPPGPPAAAAPPAPGAPPAPVATPPTAPGAPAPAPAPAAPSAPAAPGITLDQIRDKLNNWWRAHPDRSGEIMVILGEIGVQKVDDIPPAQFGVVWQKLEALGG